MSRFEFQSYTNVALNATGLASAVAYSGGGYAVSATGAADGLGHLITFTNNSATNHSAKTLTISGVDANGNPQSETKAGPAGNATVTFAKWYNTAGLTITISSTTGADTFNIGWTADAVGAMIYPEMTRVPVINIGISCVVPTGSVTYGVDYTADLTPTGLIAASWIPHAVLNAQAASNYGGITFPVQALRLHFTAAGTVNMTVLEPFRAG